MMMRGRDLEHHIRYDMRSKYIVHASVNLKRPRMKENSEMKQHD